METDEEAKAGEAEEQMKRLGDDLDMDDPRHKMIIKQRKSGYYVVKPSATTLITAAGDEAKQRN
jgi:hypothetical protein